MFLHDIPRQLLPGVRRGTIALAHGCFDVLHFGHIHHLQVASTHGDILVVSITEDRFISKPGRPVFTASERSFVLRSLRCVDHVIPVLAPTAIPLLRALRPDVYVKGSDYQDAQQAGHLGSLFQQERDLVNSYGGSVVFTDGPSYSSTATLQRLARANPDHRQEVEA